MAQVGITGRRTIVSATIVVAGLLAGGCGGQSVAGQGAAGRSSAGRGGAQQSAGGADPASVAVIRGWSDTLRRGDIQGAARYFGLPSILVNGSGAGAFELRIRTFEQAVAANETFPCGAQLISTSRRGRFINALFRLTDRPGPGGGCDGGSGLTARTDFVISHGRILEWIRAPDQPGDNAGPGASPPQPSPGGSGTVPEV